MSTFRKKMLESEMEKVITMTLREVKNSNITGKLITVTHIELNGDKSILDVYISCVPSNNLKTVVETLNKIKGLFRSKIAQNIKMFKVPELKFYEDRSYDKGRKVLDIINQLEAQKPSQEALPVDVDADGDEEE